DQNDQYYRRHNISPDFSQNRNHVEKTRLKRQRCMPEAFVAVLDVKPELVSQIFLFLQPSQFFWWIIGHDGRGHHLTGISPWQTKTGGSIQPCPVQFLYLILLRRNNIRTVRALPVIITGASSGGKIIQHFPELFDCTRTADQSA